MSVEDDMIVRRNAAEKTGEQIVPDSYQGVSKKRVREVLAEIDQLNDNKVDVIYSLLCDEPSWYPKAAKKALRFCDGASVAHIGTHVGILQRGRNIKLDREGRDYWLKPFWEIGAIEKVYLDSNAEFSQGHPVAKSANSAYRLAPDFMVILQAPEDKWRVLAEKWMDADVTRERLALQAAQAQETADSVETPHSRLIRLSYEVYAPRFLTGYNVVYVDDGDGDRITDEERAALTSAGLELTIEDSMPDVLLMNPETNHLWVIEAVTSDGEVDIHKKKSLEKYAERNGKSGVGFTTTYLTWKKAAARQTAMKNLANGTYLWIHEDPSRNLLIQQ
ncbi:BsuBI/PstI family type II restriction endonuclease [Vibrio ruber]|uniref:BsuBI/PstI family type II restriction endonuclease n=1 Tax=Vibrio ruber TaxID=184755 RepID=UPI002892B1B3|nr:BsuBI/PstI family type II restriction endonuclease [Vibrio ruber]WNJ95422.1 BsuBI/PstI family type II restriction endonuclease [Vibrio ruber]